ncbi:hypothetical protein A0H81_14494 [Grifola frondosa]|uniref:Uncharacterized protein n=1 Tax=Grifola frondosa TaxID=5627 RepID=A0A1C7LNP5_GRIFR|nr:hypothetical protein A0H81_14494 [Grifola frondosa]
MFASTEAWSCGGSSGAYRQPETRKKQARQFLPINGCLVSIVIGQTPSQPVARFGRTRLIPHYLSSAVRLHRPSLHSTPLSTSSPSLHHTPNHTTLLSLSLSTMPPSYSPCPRPILKRHSASQPAPAPRDEPTQLLAIDPSVLTPSSASPPPPAPSALHPPTTAPPSSSSPTAAISPNAAAPAAHTPPTKPARHAPPAYRASTTRVPATRTKTRTTSSPLAPHPSSTTTPSPTHPRPLLRVFRRVRRLRPLPRVYRCAHFLLISPLVRMLTPHFPPVVPQRPPRQYHTQNSRLRAPPSPSSRTRHLPDPHSRTHSPARSHSPSRPPHTRRRSRQREHDDPDSEADRAFAFARYKALSDKSVLHALAVPDLGCFGGF